MSDVFAASKNDADKESTVDDTEEALIYDEHSSDSDDHDDRRGRKRKRVRKKKWRKGARSPARSTGSRSLSKSNSSRSQRRPDNDMSDSSGDKGTNEEKLNLFSETQKQDTDELFIGALEFGDVEHGLGVGELNIGERGRGDTKFNNSDNQEFVMNHEIWNTDIPERMLLRKIPVTAVPRDSDELDREAAWIYRHGFTQHNFTRYKCGEWQGKIVTVNAIKKVCSISFSIMSFSSLYLFRF